MNKKRRLEIFWFIQQRAPMVSALAMVANMGRLGSTRNPAAVTRE